MSNPITRRERRLTTQQQHPWRASLRTALQVASVLTAAAIVAAPVLVDFIEQFWPGSPVAAWIVGGIAVLSAASAALARIAALPQVDAVLELIGLGSAPEAGSPRA